MTFHLKFTSLNILLDFLCLPPTADTLLGSTQIKQTCFSLILIVSVLCCSAFVLPYSSPHFSCCYALLLYYLGAQSSRQTQQCCCFPHQSSLTFEKRLYGSKRLCPRIKPQNILTVMFTNKGGRQYHLNSDIVYSAYILHAPSSSLWKKMCVWYYLMWIEKCFVSFSLLSVTALGVRCPLWIWLILYSLPLLYITYSEYYTWVYETGLCYFNFHLTPMSLNLWFFLMPF